MQKLDVQKDANRGQKTALKWLLPLWEFVVAEHLPIHHLLWAPNSSRNVGVIFTRILHRDKMRLRRPMQNQDITHIF